ncbi:Putative restriction-modification enzyme [Actinobacillus pleuropneumoniae serovar 2 str. 4226]|nr:Putative restriction-modification enzyme [Actinobacillus pleuropneumoniae serovar 2 str. 4226]
MVSEIILRDNLPYEIINGEERCIADEVPFEIPENWCWVRLGEIGNWGAGATPNRHEPKYYENGTIPWLKTGDLNDGIITEIPEYITELAIEKTSVKLNPVGSVLIAMYGATIGKLGILNIEATTNQACCACIPYTGIYNKYLFYYLMSQKTELQKRSEGSGQPNISKEKIVNYLFPLPPLNEQKCIVEKIETLFSTLQNLSHN